MDYFDPDAEGPEAENDEPQPRPRAKARKWSSFEPSVSSHDHVGSMSFGEDKAVCRECGQTWLFHERWSVGHFPRAAGGLSRRDVSGPSGRKPKTGPAVNMVGRGTRENDDTISGVVLRWEAEGLLGPGWRCG